MPSVEEYNEKHDLKIPAHIAIIMDGNGRWAAKQGNPRLTGHHAGVKALEKTVQACAEEGVKYMTVYAFSTENWKRPEEEVTGLFQMISLYVRQYTRKLKKENIRVQILGEYEKLPAPAVRSCRYIVEETADNTGMVFNICLNYGSRGEITRAVKQIVRRCQDEGDALTAEEITEELISSCLYTAEMPDPDMIIRTGGEKRISNYLLWQSAYSEFVYTDVLWPDFGREELMKCIAEFNGRHRRFGGLDHK